jgi:hypothetical protein
MNDDDDNDDEPEFHVRYIKDTTLDNGHGYWEEYDVSRKCWMRICDECMEKVCRASTVFCNYHHQQRHKKAIMLTTSNVKKKTKRVNKNVSRKMKKAMVLLPTQVNTEVSHWQGREIIHSSLLLFEIEPTVNDENESPSMVISVSSSLTKEQIVRVNFAMTK